MPFWDYVTFGGVLYIGVAYAMFDPPFGAAAANKHRSLLYGIGGFCLMCTFWLIWGAHRPDTGWDFTAFYIAAHLAPNSLYNHAATVKFGETYLAPIGIQYYPAYVRPAVFALLLKPMASLSYWNAYWLWAAANLVGYAVALYFLFRRLSLPTGILPAFAAFMPAIFAIFTGQDSDIFLLVVVLGFVLLLSHHQVAAGFVLALCTCKFNLILLVPLVLIIHRRGRSFVGFWIGTLSAALVSAALVPVSQYLRVLRALPSLNLNLFIGGVRGVLIGAGHERWYVPIALLGVFGCACLIRRLPLQEAFCVAILGGLLFAYHVSWYDCALMVIPIAVLWAQVGPVMKKILFGLLVFTPAWFWGWSERGAWMNVAIEIVMLSSFAALALRATANVVARPSQHSVKATGAAE